jgi:hypothetical protein
MFGIDNVGVINQRNAPAIWQSIQNDFPINFVPGRILIASDNGSIWIDITTSTRKQIVAGNIASFENGSGITAEIIPGDPSVTKFNLGGDLNQSTTININGNALNFEGNAESVIINADGYIDTQNIGIYMPITEQTIVPLVPNVIIEFTDGINGINYQVLARK